MSNIAGDTAIVELADARLSYYPGFLAVATADQLQQQLSTELNWKQAEIRLFGRLIREPRLTAWHADPGVVYSYSGRRLTAAGWPGSLVLLRQQISMLSGCEFNSMLGNLYRNGNDYMGWHSDDEVSLGSAPVVASVSLGAVRTFVLRRKDNHKIKHQIQLAHGSLLVMQGQTQHYWQHALPRRITVQQPRINLTYRWVI